MNHLQRELAPISSGTWQQLDDEAKARLTPALAARRLVDFSGPHGWQHSATNLGRVTALASSPCAGVSGLQRRVLPLIEARADFALSMAELRDADRGADDADLGPLDEAAGRIALTENIAVFHGWQDGFSGIGEISPHDPIALGGTADRYPQAVAGAVERLLRSGVGGPYGLALGSEQYRLVIETAENGGYPLLKHLRKILEGPVVWTPGVTGAIVLSQRGGDFIFDSGQDVSIGYDRHDAETGSLYLQESFSFHVATAEAAVALTP
jgi:uncharacterized linocin/CFP29 family protein